MTDEWDMEVVTETPTITSPDSDWDLDDVCPHCKKDIMPIAGKLRGSIALLVGDEPDRDDLSTGTPLSGRIGSVLENELYFQGLRYRDCRRMTMWPHPINDSEDCLQFGIQRVLKEAKHHKIILLLGAKVVKKFTGKDVGKVSSLVVQSNYFPTHVLVASVDPGIVFTEALGELRLALHTFSIEVEKLHV